MCFKGLINGIEILTLMGLPVTPIKSPQTAIKVEGAKVFTEEAEDSVTTNTKVGLVANIVNDQ